MDIQKYIASGIIESYVLGLCSATEMYDVETHADKYPALKEAIHAFEEALEKHAFENAVAPPLLLKQQVLDALQKESSSKVAAPTINAATDNAAQQPAKVVSITAAPKSIRWLRGAVAACIILLISSIMVNFYYYSRYRKFVGQYTDLLAKQNTVLAKNEVLQASYDMLKDTAMIRVPMTAPSPTKAGSFATILWDTKTKDVYLMVNNLPQHTQDKQYQLWAIVDGKPVDAGMVDMAKEGLIKMHNIPNAQAFAITLEKKGGSPVPTMDEMYVVGKV